MVEAAREIDRAAAMATRRAAQEARAAVHENARTLMMDVDALAQSLREAADLYVRARPWEVLGAVVAAGVILGLLVGRREPASRPTTPALPRQ